MYPQQLRRLTWATSFSNVSTFFPRNKHGMVMGFLTKWCHWFAVDMFFTRYIQGAVKCQLIETWRQTQVDAKVPIFLGPIWMFVALFFISLTQWPESRWLKINAETEECSKYLALFGHIYDMMFDEEAAQLVICAGTSICLFHVLIGRQSINLSIPLHIFFLFKPSQCKHFCGLFPLPNGRFMAYSWGFLTIIYLLSGGQSSSKCREATPKTWHVIDNGCWPRPLTVKS